MFDIENDCPLEIGPIIRIRRTIKCVDSFMNKRINSVPNNVKFLLRVLKRFGSVTVINLNRCYFVAKTRLNVLLIIERFFNDIDKSGKILFKVCKIYR